MTFVSCTYYPVMDLERREFSHMILEQSFDIKNYEDLQELIKAVKEELMSDVAYLTILEWKTL